MSKTFDDLDPNTWETTCRDCNTYYTGVFPEKGEPELVCPDCGSKRITGLGSPAGGMNLLYRMDY